MGTLIDQLPANGTLDGTELLELEQANVSKKGTLAALAAYIGAVGSGIVVTTQAGSSYTAVLADKNTRIRFTNGSANPFTIPPNASVPFPAGTKIEGVQAGAGVVTITAGAGVTINSAGNIFRTNGQFSEFVVTKDAAPDTWNLCGNLTA